MAARHFKVHISIITNFTDFREIPRPEYWRLATRGGLSPSRGYSVLRYITPIWRHKWGYWIGLDYAGQRFRAPWRSHLVCWRHLTGVFSKILYWRNQRQGQRRLSSAEGGDTRPQSASGGSRSEGNFWRSAFVSDKLSAPIISCMRDFMTIEENRTPICALISQLCGRRAPDRRFGDQYGKPGLKGT